MRYRLSPHVRDRMRERGISEKQIALTLDDPHVTWSTPKASVCYRRTHDDGRTLMVWVVDPMPASGLAIVKSAAWEGRQR